MIRSLLSWLDRRVDARPKAEARQIPAALPRLVAAGYQSEISVVEEESTTDTAQNCSALTSVIAGHLRRFPLRGCLKICCCRRIFCTQILDHSDYGRLKSKDCVRVEVAGAHRISSRGGRQQEALGSRLASRLHSVPASLTWCKGDAA